MNLDYLEKVLLPQREKEIEEGKNLATRQPIYVVLELQKNLCSGHNDYSSVTNYADKDAEYGYYDNSLDAEDREFLVSSEGMEDPREVTQFYTDRIASFFFTSKGAHEYINYQGHNLHNPYVYVFYSGYGNREMDALLSNG